MYSPIVLDKTSQRQLEILAAYDFQIFIVVGCFTSINSISILNAISLIIHELNAAKKNAHYDAWQILTLYI
ncbi:hypothetical protein C2G38_2163677 [Gigaspora rosea]|uniref:Uncharacterized protein n=1 Tax=Gigaspora rosea TaxID=44941 RepID=A0A397W1Y5_9GLOM|nr:hypothetical protein C2G38_2163677 [Gigaspora rosea]